jgi:hypothetical protein
MNSRRVYFGLLGLIGLLSIALIIGAYGANNLLAARAKTLTGLKAQSAALAQEQISFELAKKNIQKYAGLEQIAQAVVPQDKNQAQAVRQIVNIAAANGVSLGSITFPQSTLGSNVPGATAGSTSAAPATAATPPASSNNTKDKLSQLIPVPGIPGVYQQAITITSDTNKPILYSQLINFLNGLEHDRRTAQVNSITIQPVSGKPNYLSFTIALNEYIKP